MAIVYTKLFCLLEERGISLYRLKKMTGLDVYKRQEERMPGKPYWGSGHARLIDAFYRSLLPGGEAFPIGAQEGGLSLIHIFGARLSRAAALSRQAKSFASSIGFNR